MLNHLISRMGPDTKVAVFRALLNAWPPYAASGVRVDYIARDYRSLHVSLELRWFNRNYVGTHFGGALYAMTDPFYMLMLLQILGPGHIVWDKAATIRFRRPGTGRVSALFRLEDEDLAKLRAELDARGKAELCKTVRVLNRERQVVAEVDKVVYVRRKFPK